MDQITEAMFRDAQTALKVFVHDKEQNVLAEMLWRDYEPTELMTLTIQFGAYRKAYETLDRIGDYIRKNFPQG